MRYQLHFFFLQQHLWPEFTKVIFIFVLIAWVISISKRTNKFGNKTHVYGLWFAFLAIALFVIPWLIGIIRTPFSYRYNGLIGLSIIYPVIFTQLIAFTDKAWIRKIVVILSIMVAGAFIFFQNVASMATYTTNQRDLAVSERILSRIESHPEYTSRIKDTPHTIFLLGKNDSYESWDLYKQIHQSGFSYAQLRTLQDKLNDANQWLSGDSVL